MKFSRDLIFFRAYIDDFAGPFHVFFSSFVIVLLLLFIVIVFVLCLQIKKSGSHGVPNANLANADFGKVLCSSANKIQQNSNASSREDCIPQILTVLSFVCHS